MGESSGLYKDGIFRKGKVRISDLAGRKMLPIGNSNFATVVENSVFIDKSMLIADVLDSGSSVTLFCRPRRFGKSLNLNMLQRFFEAEVPGYPLPVDIPALFGNLAIWDADSGRYQIHAGAYPVIRYSFNDVKQQAWSNAREAIAANIAAEYRRHEYLGESDRLSAVEKELVLRLASGEGEDAEVQKSLATLSQMLFKHHGRRVVVLIDEYDAPVMAGYTYGYYAEVVGFLKGWLTGALKDNDALAFAVLTGVQRITKESIFSDLNNMTVNTALDTASDERYGFTQAEVDALAEYLGCKNCVTEAGYWYDGYRFGNTDVYNPWSTLNYFRSGGKADVYWGNTSSNAVLGDMVRSADDRLLGKLYGLLEPGGTVREPLDLGIVFPDVGLRKRALWSMLYLAGYVTTDDTGSPNRTDILRALRIPNREIGLLFQGEVIERFAEMAGGRDRLDDLHAALMRGEEALVEEELERILLDSASFFDLVNENSYHMLVLGLLFGIPYYGRPQSNREAGRGRFDIQIVPDNPKRAPLITIEIKYARPETLSEEGLRELAKEALAQVADRAYDGWAVNSVGNLRYGIAFSGKAVAVAGDRIC
ncbi:AAA family ATPase [Adlercreutzia sp. ZJ141]|uniref:AAA family ATPase n=1 Tax=Adlercreutzia sp. ZJ141 TaxID=2709406 RepID=UPI0013ED51AF|nr:AAA family ATPase [Adlercreutzia sp. ZJ141]